MFQKKTLFIVGAGASHEVSLPTGEGLSNLVAYKLDFKMDSMGAISGGDHLLLTLLKRKAQKENVGISQYYEAARSVSKGIKYSRSIDEFINKHKDDKEIQLCSKLAIAQTISEAESGSQLFINRERGENEFARPSEISKTWFFEFVRFLYDGGAKSKLESVFENVSIVNFNYDRCIEHYLYHTLQSSFAIDEERAAAVLAGLNIFHPYGFLGKLPWQSGGQGLPFGAVLRESDLVVITERIRTFFEQLQDKEEIESIRKAITNAERIIFLGFGFHSQNMTLLSPGVETSARWIAATAFGESDSAQEIIRNQIKHTLGNRHINMSEYIYVQRTMRCFELLREYSRIISN